MGFVFIMLIVSFAEKLHMRVCAALIQYMMVQWSICSLYIHIDTYFLEGKHVVAAGVVCHWFVTHTRACALSFSLTHECALFFLSLSLSLSLSHSHKHTQSLTRADVRARQSAAANSWFLQFRHLPHHNICGGFWILTAWFLRTNGMCQYSRWLWNLEAKETNPNYVYSEEP